MISEEVFANCSAWSEAWELCGATLTPVSLRAEREKHVYIFNKKVETQREKIELFNNMLRIEPNRPNSDKELKISFIFLSKLFFVKSDQFILISPSQTPSN